MDDFGAFWTSLARIPTIFYGAKAWGHRGVERL